MKPGQHKNGAPDDSGVLALERPAPPAEAPKLKDRLGTIAIAFGLIAAIGSGYAFMTTTTATAIDDHAKQPHSDAVHVREFDRHVADEAKRDDEAREERRELGDKLDAIGEKLYESREEWTKAAKAK